MSTMVEVVAGSPSSVRTLRGEAAGGTRTVELWHAVERLIDHAEVEGLLAHKLGPLAAIRRRATGRDVPQALADEERAASFAMLSAAPLLRRIREVADGPLLLLKGPEVATLYPRGGRRFGDVDVLAPDAIAVHRALQEQGFVEFDREDFDHTEHHHLVPLRWPVIPLDVEVHSMPNWPPRLRPPDLAEIFEAALPSAFGVEGLLAPHPVHHALMLAAHAWRHEPLQTLRDLVDVAALSAAQDPRELERTAQAWGIGRIWRTTSRTIEALFFHGSRTLPLRIWARHLVAVRERTVFESHLERALQPFWGFPLRIAVSEAAGAIRVDLAPAEEETWGDKLRRVPRAIREARVPLSRHVEPERPPDRRPQA